MSDLTPVSGLRPVWLDDKTKSIMDRAIAREQSLSRMLMTYIVTGLIFMLLPGTFLGVWNLIKISSHEAADSISPAWIQAHGHAQLFGWVGTFIPGIRLLLHSEAAETEAVCTPGGLAVFGTLGRRCDLPLVFQYLSLALAHHVANIGSARTTCLLHFLSEPSQVTGRRSGVPKPWEPWIFVVVAATMGLLTSLVLNLRCIDPTGTQRGVTGFLARIRSALFDCFDLGFSGSHGVGLQFALASRVHGAATLAESPAPGGARLEYGGRRGRFLRAFYCGRNSSTRGERRRRSWRSASSSRRRSQRRPSTSTEVSRYSSGLPMVGFWYAGYSACGPRVAGEAAGIWGASRHALTVGFIAGMVFCVGQRVLPSFCGMRVLWSPRLMLWMLVLLMTGCTLRVASEILAYQGYADWAWNGLPVSALIELTRCFCSPSI